MEGLQEKLGRCRAGDKVDVVVKRADNGEYKKVTVTVTLGNKSDAPTE
jgi:serine protease Do